ncbi:hypothetical protein, conserved [Eimeria praecox]|uniref:Transmembrane protein n=1 Tax=Eimeria praecox TaxID=51316 RepID=U6H3P1_9EIME|nr:hypothetical protein, conserved [Eimeria praecox]
MVPPCGTCRVPAAKDTGIFSRSGRILRVVRAVAVPSLLWHLCGTPDGSTFGVSFASASTSSSGSPSTSTVAPPSSVGEEATATALQQQTPSYDAEDDDAVPVFRSIPYDTCSIPLAVGGEIVRCGKDGGGKPHLDFVSFDGPQGPVLNQSFPVDISPDFFLRRSIGRDREIMERNTEAESPSSKPSTEQGKTGETSHMQIHEKGGSMVEPHFIRIFGRWTSYPRGLNLWLNRDAAPTLERRLAGEGAVAALLGEHDSLSEVPPQRPVFAQMGISPQPRLAHPVLYWRQTITSSPMENSCIALIKLPATQKGSADPSSSSAAASIPDSCQDAQRLLSEQRSSATVSADPFWLSCGPELQLSRLAKYITFPISQEKINKVLAALDYSVEVWQEPHEVEHSEEGSAASSSDSARANPEAASEKGETAPEGQQEAFALRGGEARRLAVKHEALPEEPPKWRVGVCLLSSQKGKEAAQAKVPVGDTRKQNTAVNATASTQPRGEKQGADAAARAELDPQRDEKTKEGVAPRNGRDEKQTGNVFSEAVLVGELKFHLSPAVASQADENPGEPESIQIRHFIDAGWIYTRYIQGANVSRFNRLAIKESRGGIAQPCVGFWEEHSLLSVAPDAYSWDEATQKGTLRFVYVYTFRIVQPLQRTLQLAADFSVTELVLHDKLKPLIMMAYKNSLVCNREHVIKFGSSLREGVDNSEALFDAVPGHHQTARMHICFYPNEEQPFGLFMGEVRFVIDSADATLLVCFILFVFLALPLTCAVALSFHVYKHRHLRERLQRLVLVQQRDAVEQLLMRELGISAEDQDDANDDDDDEDSHP